MTSVTYLEWPDAWPRTPERLRKRGRFKDPTIAWAYDDVLRELNLLNATRRRVSVDCPPRRDGQGIIASGPAPRDPGVALYFMLRGKPHVMACDTYKSCADNLRALSLTIASLRAIERHGASGILDRAMAGFTALPPGAGAGADPDKPARPWWEVLNIPQIDGVRFEEIGGDTRHPMRTPLLAMAESLYRSKVPFAHPDRGGSTEAMVELGRAIEECRAALGKQGA